MNALRVIGIVLIVGGIAGLAYGKFSYTKATHDVKVGPIEFAVKEKKTVNVPMWGGISAIAAGLAMLVAPGKKSAS